MLGVRGNSCPTFNVNLLIAMEEHESEVHQIECSMECSLLGEEEQNHSAGTDIVQIMVYGIY